LKSIFDIAYLKGIQDVGVFVSTVFAILIFSGQHHLRDIWSNSRCLVS